MSDEEKKTMHKHRKEGKKGKDRKNDMVVAEIDETNGADIEETSGRNEVKGGENEGITGKIDIHTLNYFKRVEKLLNEDEFDDEESKELFLSNVLAQIGKGMKTCQLARHRLTSKVLECLVEMCNSEQFSEIFESLMEEILAISRDRFGSHVLQRVVCTTLKHLAHNNKVLTDKIESLFFQLVTEMKKNLPSLIRDTYSSHILSSLVQALAGVRIPENVTRSRNSQTSRGKLFRRNVPSRQGKEGPIMFGVSVEKSQHPVPDSFTKKLHKLTKRITKDYNFGELLCHKNASVVIQILLLALKENEKRSCERLCNMILEKSKLLQQCSEMETDDTNSRVPILFADEVGSHVMEKIFYVASNDLYEVMFSKCFKNNLLKFSLHPLANYILQHMLRNIPSQEIASVALEDLSPFTEDILASGNMGVVIRMAELAKRFNCKQKDVFSAIIRAVHLPPGKKERKSLIKLLLTLSTYDVMFEKGITDENGVSPHGESNEASTEPTTGKLTNETMNYHGACLSKILFHFEDPKILVKSLLSLKEELFFLVRHEFGSFVIEEFIASNSVSKSHKTKFLLMMKDNIVTIAKDKFGSHVIDKLWSNGTEDERNIIREQLIRFRGQLKGNMYGRIVLRNCGIESFQIPNKATGKDQSRHTEGQKSGKEKGVTEKKQEKKRRSDELHATEVEDIERKKKAKTDFASPFNDELLKLGVGVGSNDGEWRGSKGDTKNNFGKESSKEIDELFAKSYKKKKKKM